ncbi:hypothetical protein [uncultured Tateyamaria sp.]|nr:hypothetical protein [uncultured Tateyamaria sp.]
MTVTAVPTWAEIVPMMRRASLLTEAAPLFDRATPAAAGQASLFVGTTATSLFGKALSDPSLPRGTGGTALQQLRSLIAKAEAGAKGYDAVQYGAWVLPGAPPTQMTLGDIYAWIDATPGMPHAIGRYQFIPPTLRRLANRLDLSESTVFTPRVQDALADVLLREAGLHRFLAGEMPRHGFMNNLAKIWAGLPNDTGKSHYHGYAGNKATMTWAAFDAQMAQIFPG